jgi:hypothetical protein
MWTTTAAIAQFGPAVYVVQPAGGGGASFTGIGDAKSGAHGHYGVISYSAAQRGQNMLNLCNGGVCADVASDATTGIVPNAPTINGAPCNNSTHICTIAKMYDDSGATLCAGGTVACVIDTGSATFIVSASGSVPGIGCSGSGKMSASGLFTQAQPLATGASYEFPSTPGGTQSVWGDGTNILQGVTSAAKPFGYNGTTLTASSAVSTNTFVAATMSQDGSGNGSLQTNAGTATTGAIGSNTWNSGNPTVCGDTFSQFFNGTVLEVFMYPVQLSGADDTAIVGKMRTNGGF